MAQKWNADSVALYKKWRVWHAKMVTRNGKRVRQGLYFYREFEKLVHKEAKKSSARRISAKAIWEEMRHKRRHAIYNQRLSIDNNMIPFYSAFFRVLNEEKHPDIVVRIEAYRSKHDPEGQVRAWLGKPSKDGELVQAEMWEKDKGSVDHY